jgi:ABC-type branched-subunit amino acid transport system ATPase component
MCAEIVLSVNSLVKEFGGLRAVDNLSFEVRQDTITALIGPNGSGKTTVFNLINGFLKPNSGSILLQSMGRTYELAKLPPYKIARLGVARTFQNTRLFSQLTVMENMLLATRYDGKEGFFAALFQLRSIKELEKQNRRKAEKYLELVELTHKKDEIAQNLSHGQRKLLDLARSLATEAEVLLLDEPTAGIFPELKTKVIELLKIMKENGKTILLIEHDMGMVTEIADNIVVLNYGRKIAEGTPEQIIKNAEVIAVYSGRGDMTCLR